MLLLTCTAIFGGKSLDPKPPGKKYELLPLFGLLTPLIHPCNCGASLWTRGSGYTDDDQSLAEFFSRMDLRVQWWQKTFQETD